MDDIQVINYLTHALHRAASEDDWSQVQELDEKIAGLLSILHEKPLEENKRSALKRMRSVHRQARERCRQQSEWLEQKMSLQRRNQKGAVAYAAFMNDEDLR